MDTAFWHRKWEKNDIAFHGSEANPLLVKYFDKLSLARESRVFLPLCGKTRDISWFLSRGYRIVGSELVALAIEQLFADLDMEFEITRAGEAKRYSAKDIDIFVGDIFCLSKSLLGPVGAVYDRAALVALPKEMRKRYAAQVQDVTREAPQLLISYEYDQAQMEGPPFSISGDEIRERYGSYDVTLLESVAVPGGLKGKCAASENAWLLSTKK
ncbi:MAG TPA: thiopurine S-methyltransferase [Verrucomicrobiae bacterium]|nr:thiopurine S-methyltransferase [Verrucomicrobiae bacterium]